MNTLREMSKVDLVAHSLADLVRGKLYEFPLVG
jgi:hypothetical protein